MDHTFTLGSRSKAGERHERTLKVVGPRPLLDRSHCFTALQSQGATKISWLLHPYNAGAVTWKAIKWRVQGRTLAADSRLNLSQIDSSI